jgi:type II secretory pathway pseudopilin PulG
MPQIIGIIGAIAGIAGTVAGQITSAGARDDARRAAEEAARVQLEQINLEESSALGDEERRARRLAGAQRASFGRSGVALLGSPLDVLLDTEYTAQRNLSRLRLTFESERDAVGAQLGITNQRIDAEGTAAIASGIGSFGNTLLTGAQFFSKPATNKPKFGI